MGGSGCELSRIEVPGIGNATVVGSGPGDLWIRVANEDRSPGLLHSSGGAFSPVSPALLKRMTNYTLLEPAGQGALWVWGHSEIEGPIFAKVTSAGTVEEVDVSSIHPEETVRTRVWASDLAARGNHLFVVTDNGSSQPRLWRRAGSAFEEIALPPGTVEVGLATVLENGEFWTALRFGAAELVVHRWDGSAWSALPAYRDDGHALDRLSIWAPDDVWLGLAHWNGSAWTASIPWSEFRDPDPVAHPPPRTVSVAYIPVEKGVLGVIAAVNISHKPMENTASLWAWRWRAGTAPSGGRRLGTAKGGCTHSCPGGVSNYLQDGSVVFSFDSGNGSSSSLVTVPREAL